MLTGATDSNTGPSAASGPWTKTWPLAIVRAQTPPWTWVASTNLTSSALSLPSPWTFCLSLSLFYFPTLYLLTKMGPWSLAGSWLSHSWHLVASCPSQSQDAFHLLHSWAQKPRAWYDGARLPCAKDAEGLGAAICVLHHSGLGSAKQLLVGCVLHPDPYQGLRRLSHQSSSSSECRQCLESRLSHFHQRMC